MAKRISNLAIEKTPEYIEREWIAITAKRQQSLQSSDWTQLLDNNLTFEAQVRWNHWRTLVRNVTRDNFATIGEADTELDKLHANQPAKEYTHTTARQKKYQLDMTSLVLAKADANKIVREFIYDSLKNTLHQPLQMTMLQVSELEVYLKSGATDFTLYPILDMASKLNSWSVEETVDGIFRANHVASETVSKLMKTQALYIEHVNRSLTVNEVINVIKTMHGY